MSKNRHLIEGIEPKYYARIPNMIIDDLNYSELALYTYYKRVAYDTGSCWQSTATIGKSLKMSPKKVKATRRLLEKRGLITVTANLKGDVECSPKTIRIVNIWQENIDRYNLPPVQNDPPLGTNCITPGYVSTHKEKESKTNKENQDLPPTVNGDGDASIGDGSVCHCDVCGDDDKPLVLMALRFGVNAYVCAPCHFDITDGKPGDAIADYPQMVDGWQQVTHLALNDIYCTNVDCNGMIERGGIYYVPNIPNGWLCSGCWTARNDKPTAKDWNTCACGKFVAGHCDCEQDLSGLEVCVPHYKGQPCECGCDESLGEYHIELSDGRRVLHDCFKRGVPAQQSTVADLGAKPGERCESQQLEVTATVDDNVSLKTMQALGQAALATAKAIQNDTLPKAKSKKARKAKQQANDAMMEAIIAATPKLDRSKIKGGAWGPYRDTAKWLLIRDATPDDMTEFVPFVLAESKRQGWEYSVRCLTGKDRWAKFCGQRQAQNGGNVELTDDDMPDASAGIVQQRTVEYDD
jgi:hypothetical protein